MSTNAGKLKAKLKLLSKQQKKKKPKKTESKPSDGQIAVSLIVPSFTPSASKEDLQESGTDTQEVTSEENKPQEQSENLKENILGKLFKKKTKLKRFTEAASRVDEGEVLRSPSRLGYREEIPPIVVEGSWENTSQDSNRENYHFLDLKEITDTDLGSPRRNTAKFNDNLDIETKEIGNQTDFPLTPSSFALTPKETHTPKSRQFVSSQKFLNEKGHSPKHPYEKTVFFVKSTPVHNNNTSTKAQTCQVTHVNRSPIPVSYERNKTEEVLSPSIRIDSGYGSRAETIRIPSPTRSTVGTRSATSLSDHQPLTSASDRNSQRNSPDRPVSSRPYDSYRTITESKPDRGKLENKMSYYPTEIISPTSVARKQEKEDLQMLNERFSSYILKVRHLSEHTNQLDSASFIKQTRILEEEVANLKMLYERELDAMRQELNTVGRERSNYQLQCEKNKQAAIDFETRMAVESDKNRRLMDDMNQLQRKVNSLESELMGLKQHGDGRVDFQHLQREMDKLLRENEDHKHRQEQESLLRTEAEDRSHTLVKKLEFNEQVHTQQMAELRERLEQSQATIISLESRINTSTKNDLAIPEVLKQVREQAEIEFKRYQLESQETYNRNISALKCQMDNDAHTIERMSRDKTELQGQVGELQAKIRNLEGQLMTLDHQKTTVENMIAQERGRAAEQLREMESKLRDMQELVFTKMREANSERDLHIPLKAEIEAMKILLEEEEKRLHLRTSLQLQLPLTVSHQSDVQSYTANTPISLPAVSAPVSIPQPEYAVTSSSGQYAATSNAQYMAQSTAQYTSQPSTQYTGQSQTQYTGQGQSNTQYTGQYAGTSDDQFAVSTGENYVSEPIPNTEPIFMHVPLPSALDPATSDYVGTTRYTYETTPSVNRLQIDSPPRTSPRAIGPISRAKSAPVRPGSQVQVVPTALGQGKDYFDEMFRDLTRETLYTQTRPKSSPLERPPSAPRERPASALREKPQCPERSEMFVQPAMTMEEPQISDRPASRASDRIEAVPATRNSDRPHSSVFHDYTTASSSATGDVKILEVNQDGKFVRLFNDGKQEVEFGGYMIQQNVGGHPVAVFRFPPRTKFPCESTMTIWSGSQDPIEHQPPKDFVWREQHRWGTGPECTTILCKPNGQAVAWMTAAHRFTKNLYEDSGKGSPTEECPVLETGATQGGQEMLTEMNVNLNEPKPEPVYLRREKQSPPSLTAQKHPHGGSPGRDTHPHTGQPRPFTYGNDNSSVNRQSRVQSTRPDPIQGQPYAGGSGNRIGSAPLRKYKSAVTNGNIRGSGAIANRSNPGTTTEPPNPFQTPRNRFEQGLDQIQSQHHVHFNPPMPRPPLFSTW